ncbi:MAG: DUF1214 domain-containing protein [Pseudomonadota bacterium]
MRALAVIPVIIAGLAVGVLSALWAAGLVDFGARGATFSDVDVDGWATDRAIGSASANPYTRARVARHGLLALAKEEAIYFTRRVDADGAPFREACAYEISGAPIDAAWWSVTLYDAESRLPMNDDGALSIDATGLGNDGAWRAVIAAKEPAEGAWLSSRNAGAFDLTLRLYRASRAILEDPQTTLTPPRITRLSCSDEGQS